MKTTKQKLKERMPQSAGIDDALPDVSESLWQYVKDKKRTKKVPISIRLDEEVLSYFKALVPEGYQTHMNQVLWEWIQVHEFSRRKND